MSNSKTAAALQQAVTDSYAALIETHRFHWNYEGEDFYGWHKLSEQIYNEQFTAIDEIAERLRAVDKKVDISPESLAKSSSVKFGNNPQDLLASQTKLVEVFKKLEEASGNEGDTVSQDLANNRMAVHEKNIWLIKTNMRSKK